MISKNGKFFGGLVALTLAASGCASTKLPTKDFTPYTVTVEYQGTEVTTRYEGENKQIIYSARDKPKMNNQKEILADLASTSNLYCLR